MITRTIFWPIPCNPPSNEGNRMLARPEEVFAQEPIPVSPVKRLIQQHGPLRSCKRHALIYSPEDPASPIYLISDGEVGLSRNTPEGRELTVDHPGAGCFGAAASLGRNSAKI